MHPLVSVILPNHNYAQYLDQSISAILGQSLGDLELLIIDDFSSDNSKDIIETFRKRDKRIFTFYNSRNHGVSYARNRAIEKSAGKYIAFCDSDDVWLEDKLKIQIKKLEYKKEYDVAFCDCLIIDEHGTETGSSFSSKYGKPRNSEGNLFRELFETNFISNSTVVFRKNCVGRVGLQDERLRYLQDWFYWICLARHFRFIFIDSILAKYREHSRSTNINKRGYSKERILTYQAAIDYFFDLSNEIKSALYYKIGCEHSYLGEKEKAYESFIHSSRFKKHNLKSYLRILSLILGLEIPHRNEKYYDFCSFRFKGSK